MKLISRLILTCGLTTLLLACDSGPETDRQTATAAATVEPADVTTTPAAVVEATSMPMPVAGRHVIDLSSGMVSIRANQVYEPDLLYELAALANFQLLTGEVDWKTVSVDMQALPLHAALGELLQNHFYQIVYTPDKYTRHGVLSEVFVGGLSAAAISDGKDTDAASKATLRDAEEQPDDGQQRVYIQQLQNPRAEVRAAAAIEIEPVGDALYVLTDMLVTDPSPEVRIATIEALEDSDDPLAVEALVKCLQDENPDVIEECVDALEDSDDPLAVKALVICLQDEKPYVIVECTEALDWVGDETTVQHLEPLLTHYDPTVNTAAAEAIESLQ
jgi:hypothetical protein